MGEKAAAVLLEMLNILSPYRCFYYSLLSCGSILFWTDWDASLPRIEAASMSGEGRRTIHRETGSGGWPNGLTVDYMERRIVWIDAR